MDFTNRGPQAAHQAPAHGTASPSGHKNKQKNGSSQAAKWGAGVLGLLILALVVGVIVVIGLGGKKAESAYVKNDQLQAVFLQTGQVYFGDITALTEDYFVLNNIYYLQTGSTTEANASADVSLVKLGCELHSPFDEMVINRDQVTFWENLHTDGQVAKAVAKFKSENPQGQNCVDQSAAPNSDSGVQNTTPTADAATEEESTSDN